MSNTEFPFSDASCGALSTGSKPYRTSISLLTLIGLAPPTFSTYSLEYSRLEDFILPPLPYPFTQPTALNHVR